MFVYSLFEHNIVCSGHLNTQTAAHNDIKTRRNKSLNRQCSSSRFFIEKTLKLRRKIDKKDVIIVGKIEFLLRERSSGRNEKHFSSRKIKIIIEKIRFLQDKIWDHNSNFCRIIYRKIHNKYHIERFNTFNEGLNRKKVKREKEIDIVFC